MGLGSMEDDEQRVELYDALLSSKSFLFRNVPEIMTEELALGAKIISVEAGDVIAGPTHAEYKKGVGFVLIEGGLNVVYDKMSRTPPQHHDLPGEVFFELEMLWNDYLDRSLQAATFSQVAVITHAAIKRHWAQMDVTKLLMVLDSTARDARVTPRVGHKVALARGAWRLKAGAGLPLGSALPAHHCYGTVKRVIRWNEYFVEWEDGSHGTYYTGWDNVEAVRRFNLLIIDPPPSELDVDLPGSDAGPGAASRFPAPSPLPRSMTPGRRKSIADEAPVRDVNQIVTPLVASRGETLHGKRHL